MTLQPREKRLVIVLAVAAPLCLAYLLFSGGSATPATVGAPDTIKSAEKRLEKVRARAAEVQGKEQLLKQVSTELAEREKSIIQAETTAQAQAQLIDIVRRVSRGQTPSLEFGSFEMNQQVVRLGEDYGEIQVNTSVNCRMEELVNFLADLSRQPEALVTNELRISSLDPKQKTISARMTVAGVVPKRLVPQKKGMF